MDFDSICFSMLTVKLYPPWLYDQQVIHVLRKSQEAYAGNQYTEIVRLILIDRKVKYCYAPASRLQVIKCCCHLMTSYIYTSCFIFF